MLRWCIGLFVLSTMAGCGDPPLNPITGKVTLDGKPYERLIVYFRPIDEEVSSFNLGVGETDKDGVLTLRSTAGNGLQRGKYRVSFSCVVPVNRRGARAGNSPDGKNDDDRTLVTKEIVPEPYSTDTESPVEFEVQSGENVFEFDIPGKSGS